QLEDRTAPAVVAIVNHDIEVYAAQGESCQLNITVTNQGANSFYDITNLNGPLTIANYTTNTSWFSSQGSHSATGNDSGIGPVLLRVNLADGNDTVTVPQLQANFGA